MQSFLSQAVTTILAQQRPLKDLTIVLPSQRAAVFFKRELQNQLSKAAICPRLITVEDLMLQSTGLEALPSPALLFALYEAYLSVTRESEDFAEFSKWAHLLLADFNEVDRYLIDASHLFNHLADIKRIESWNLEKEPTELIKNYLALWESLPPLYQAFTQKLLDRKQCYQGLAYRQMAERLPQLLNPLKQRYGHFYFLGFNALNQAEEQIFKQLYQANLATFYWDVDEYYFKDKDHEAGRFLRQSKLVQLLQERKEFHGLHQSLSSEAKNVHSVAVNGNHLQGVAANSILNAFENKQWENTAVVLADENLLPAFLNNLNANIKALNVTMGLPLELSPLGGLFKILIGFQRSFERKPQKRKNNEATFYHQQWDDLMAQPLLKQMAPQAGAIEKVRQALRQRNLVYASHTQLLSLGFPDVFPAVLFEPAPSLPAYFEGLAQLCLKAQDQGSKRQTEMLFGFYQLFNQLQQLFKEYPYVKDFETALFFYRDLLRQETTDLVGEPLSGLQVMGMLETRTLDFENLVLTSVNEDILPKGRSQNSLIPFDIKKAYHLPTFLEKDAVYAYHFYRLLQRAKNVYMLYNNGSQGMRVGEASRFIRQVEMELQQHHTQKHLGSTFSRSSFTAKAQANSLSQPMVQKTPAVLERLHQMAQEGLSPSALTTYLRNPLDFYYQYVLRLREPDEIDEALDLRIQGTVAHEVLEELYGQKNDDGPTQPKTASEIAAVHKTPTAQLRQQIEHYLQKEWNLPKVDIGLNLLAVEIITGMLSKFLTFDAKRYKQAAKAGTPLEITGLEENLRAKITVNPKLRVQLKGNADRVEKWGPHYRIIDYKTGNAQNSDYGLGKEGLENLSKKPKALQLLMYGYMFLQSNPQAQEVQPQIISLRNLNLGAIDLKINQETGMNRNLYQDFEEHLAGILSEIFNPEVPFKNVVEDED